MRRSCRLRTRTLPRFAAVGPRGTFLSPDSQSLLFLRLSCCFVSPVPKADTTCYNMCIPRCAPPLEDGQFPMRLAVVTTFHDTISCSFNSTVEMTGTSVRNVIYERLERCGVQYLDISTRFDHVVAILNESLWRKRSSDRVQDVSGSKAARFFATNTLQVGDTIQLGAYYGLGVWA